MKLPKNLAPPLGSDRVKVSTLRQMAEADLRAINLLLSKAFTHARYQEGYQKGRVPLCRLEFLQLYFKANPSGSFVIEEDYKIIAFCFSRLWGKTGWFGPLGVDPLVQGQGHGTRIVLRAVENLKRVGARTIGLETSANSSRNLAFYSRLGFEFNSPTVDLIRRIVPKERPAPGGGYERLRYSELSGNERSRFLRSASDLWKILESGLDYTREMDLTADKQFGDACLLTDAAGPVAFVLAHTETYSQAEERQFIKINVLQISPERPVQVLDLIIESIEEWARAEDLSSVYIRVPTRYHKGFSYLLTLGFSIVQNDLRLTLENYPQSDDPERINFSKWE